MNTLRQRLASAVVECQAADLGLRVTGESDLRAAVADTELGVALGEQFSRAAERDPHQFREQPADPVTAYGLDGIDIDWEYPDPVGSSSANFSLLMQELCGALHGQGKLCSAAVVATGWTAAGVGSDVLSAVDYLTLMAYDGGNGADHSPYSYAVASLNYWLGRGLPAAKAILGVPFYGRPSWEGYATIVARDAQAPYKDVSNGVYYNGLDTIKAKTALGMQRGGGVMIWELAQDTADETTSLLNAIWSVIGAATIDPAPTPPPTPTSR